MKSIRVLLLALALSSTASAEEQPWTGYQTVRLAEGVYAFISPEGRSGIYDCNSLVVIGDAGVLVFDSSQFPSIARRRIADIRKLTSKPVRYLVNSHWHYDHTNGNAAYRDAFPGVVIVSHDFTRKQAPVRYDEIVTNYPKLLDSITVEIRALLDKGTRADGKPLSAEQRGYFERIVTDGHAILPEIRAARYVGPELTFDDALALHLGAREVRLQHLGRGNTGGDVVAWVPDAKVLATGDVVVWPIPFAFGCYPSEWMSVLARLGEFDFTNLVPGHGPVMHDKQYLSTVAELLGAVVKQVRAAYEQKWTLEQTQTRVDLSAFRERMAGSDVPRRQAFGGAFLQPAVERAYQEAQGKLAPE